MNEAEAEEAARLELADEEGIGPGRSAEMDAHVKLFRELQLQYACFDAYARAALGAAANQVLLVLAYFVIGHCMVKDNGSGIPIMSRALVWCAVVVCCVASRVLFKLDLFVSKRRLRFVKEAFVAGPAVSCLAAHFWTDARSNSKTAVHIPDPIINSLAVLAAILHTVWQGIQIWQARPGPGPGSLPTAYRSVQYLDVFGWQDKVQDEEEDAVAALMLQNMSEHALEAHELANDEERLRERRTMRAIFKNKSQRLLRKVQELRSVSMAEQLSAEDVRKLAELEKSLMGIISTEKTRTLSEELDRSSNNSASLLRLTSASSGSEMPRVPSVHELWLQSVLTADSGQDVEYFVNSSTGEVRWEAPREGQIIRINELGAQIDNLQLKQNHQNWKTQLQH
jgi:hypothetical protein